MTVHLEVYEENLNPRTPSRHEEGELRHRDNHLCKMFRHSTHLDTTLNLSCSFAPREIIVSRLRKQTCLSGNVLNLLA